MKRSVQPAGDALFIERLGLHFERQGVARIAGQILAAVMLAEGPVSLETLARTLEVSRGSISTNVNLLERGGIIARRAIAGDRKHYVEMGEQGWEAYLERAVASTLAFREMCEGAFSGLPASRARARKRLKAGIEVMELLQEHFQAAFAVWRRRKSVSPMRS